MHSKYSRNKNCNLDKSQIAVFQYTILFSAYINSTRNGKRVEFRKEVVDKLGVSDVITVCYDDEKVIFFKPIDDTDTVIFNVRKSCGKTVIYSYQLVEELAEFFNLDFTTRVCHTLSDGGFDVFEEDNQPVLFIRRAELEWIRITYLHLQNY